MRLDRYLHEAGVGTRREVNLIIRARRVRVDGEEVRDGARHVRDGASVELDGAVVAPIGKLILLFYKPAGFVTSTRDENATIYSVLPKLPADVLPVGRLDKDTEGLLLLTNDGQLLHRLTSPRWHVEKEYVAELRDAIEPGAELTLLKPLDLGNGETSRGAIAAERQNSNTIKIVIDEGKYHQVKRMVRAIGNEVIYLKRTRVGPVSLGGAERGSVRSLTKDEENALRSAVGWWGKD
ncbi:MAG: pseudouridine synthase [Planctomycetota bacterium]